MFIAWRYANFENFSCKMKYAFVPLKQASFYFLFYGKHDHHLNITLIHKYS